MLRVGLSILSFVSAILLNKRQINYIHIEYNIPYTGLSWNCWLLLICFCKSIYSNPDTIVINVMFKIFYGGAFPNTNSLLTDAIAPKAYWFINIDIFTCYTAKSLYFRIEQYECFISRMIENTDLILKTVKLMILNYCTHYCLLINGQCPLSPLSFNRN